MYPSTPEIYTLSLHDALPILTNSARSVGLTLGLGHSAAEPHLHQRHRQGRSGRQSDRATNSSVPIMRSEEHTSELQSHSDLVCLLLLEKKKKKSGMRSISAMR